MARIRTVKPEFFRHEMLQDLEKQNPGAYPMLLFEGLWGHCDKQGVFAWRPKMLALDILPFIWKGSTGEALGKTLVLLEENGLILRLVYDDLEYGYIPSFSEHQRMSGREAQDPSKFPELSKMTRILNGEATGKHSGSNGEALWKAGREGKGREGKGRERGGGACAREGENTLGLKAIDEVERIRDQHFQICGLASVPPLQIVQEILQKGIAPSMIDDVYQAHGGDILRYRQRNIVERLTALRDGIERSPPKPGMGPVVVSASERRQTATFAAARAFAGGEVD